MSFFNSRAILSEVMCVQYGTFPNIRKNRIICFFDFSNHYKYIDFINLCIGKYTEYLILYNAC